MEYQVISNVTDPLKLFIEPSMTVGEVRGVVSAMTLESEEWDIRLTFQGHILDDDDETWDSVTRRCPVQPGRTPKLFSHASKKRGEQVPSAANMVPVADEGGRQLAKMMEPVIDMMVNNPGMLDMLTASQPSLRRVIEKDPEMGRLLSNPETLKTIMMSMIDPDQRRNMSRSMLLQLAQISAIPGGEQLLERYTSDLLNKIDTNLDHAADSAPAGGEEENEGEHSEPVRGPNEESAPNPWNQSTSPTADGGVGSFFASGLNPLGSRGDLMDTGLGRLLGVDAGALRAQSLTSFPAQQAEAIALQRATDAARWSQQLAMLKDMGFMDEELCLEALRVTDGDVDMAVNFIVSRDSL